MVRNRMMRNRGEPARSQSVRWMALLLLLLGAALRIHALGTAGRLHPDEALFATFARRAAVQGDWLLSGALDKPPLTLYADALSMGAFGVTALPDGVLTLEVYRGELAARLPGLAASILLLPLVYHLALCLWRDPPTALIALALVVCSPLALAFSATVFTDGLLLLMLAAALVAALRGQWGWAGVWLALGVGCKQQALLYLPLLLAVGWVRRERRCGLLLLPLLGGLALLTAWEAARGTVGSVWALAAVNNEPARLAHPADWLPRLQVWWGYGQVAFGASLVTVALLALAAWGARGRMARALLAYCLLYMVAHTVLGINIYDRYLLPLLPPLALLAANGLRSISRKMQIPRWGWAAAGGVLLVVSVMGGQARLGSDVGTQEGIDRVATYLNERALGAIVYDRWLGWELGYYMGAWSDKRRVYYPTPRTLAAGAIQQPDRAPRYFPVPEDAPYPRWLRALDDAGFEVQIGLRLPLFTVYELIPPSWVGCASAVESSWRVRTVRYAGLCE